MSKNPQFIKLAIFSLRFTNSIILTFNVTCYMLFLNYIDLVLLYLSVISHSILSYL